MYFGVMASHMGWGVIEEEGWRKGPWTAQEDRLLIEYVRLHGEGRWNSVSRLAGLKRNGKSCRLRWVNYLRPDLKRGQITPHEESIIIELHARWGNRWSTIARSLPGRTDNEIKNYWRTHFKKKTKVSSDTAEKAKTRLLKRQQFQQQQRLQQQKQQQLMLHEKQKQQQQQQQQLLQLNQFDMKGLMAIIEENDHKSPSLSQTRQEVPIMYPNNTEEQGNFYSILNGNNASVLPQAMNEDTYTLWDGLWNLEDIHGNFSVAGAANRANLHNLVAPFC